MKWLKVLRRAIKKPNWYNLRTTDCFIVTQTLNFIYDVKSAVKGIFHMLKDGGIILATVAGIFQISRYDIELSNNLFNEIKNLIREK